MLPDSSQEDRIDWMEAIMPGSSVYLQRFSKSGSLRQHATSPQSPTFDPHPAADDLGVSNGNHPEMQHSIGQEQQYSSSANPQPLNYMEPVPSFAGNTQPRPQNTHPRVHTIRSNSDADISSAVPAPHFSYPGTNSADSTLKDRNVQTDAAHSRHATVAHMEHKSIHLSTSSSEGVQRIGRKSPEHLYELDATNMMQSEKHMMQSEKPPLPARVSQPKAKPRNKQPSRTRSDFQSKSSSRDTDEVEPRYQSPEELKPQLTLQPSHSSGKEADYHLSVASRPKPVPKERGRPAAGDSPQMLNTSRPPVKPRKNVGPVEKPLKQTNYLDLVDEDHTAKKADLTVGFSKELIQNFSPHQLDMLVSMLQQVQADGKQNKPAVVERVSGLEQDACGKGLVESMVKKDFGESVCLQSNTIPDHILFMQRELLAIRLSFKLIKCKCKDGKQGEGSGGL